MDTYLHVSLDPSYRPGEATIDVTVNRWEPGGDGERITVEKIPALNAEFNDSTRLELWIVAALRNIASAVEADMFSRLTGDKEKLTLEPMKRKKDLGVPALTPSPGRQ